MDNILILKTLCALIFIGIFVYGIIGLRSGRVHCKGCCYQRGENPVGFWSTIAIYLLGTPILLFVLFTR